MTSAPPGSPRRGRGLWRYDDPLDVVGGVLVHAFVVSGIIGGSSTSFLDTLTRRDDNE